MASMSSNRGRGRGRGRGGRGGFGGGRQSWADLTPTMNTADSDPLVRRMDSLARIMDIDGTRVTAVGFDSKATGMLVAANIHPHGRDAYMDAVATRMGALQDFISADFGSRRARRDAALSVMHEIGSPFRSRRFVRDLIKLRRSVRGEYDAKSGKNFSEAQRASIMADSWRVHRAGDDVHAELDVASRAEAGPLGVSKLSCRDCHDYIVTYRPDVQLRGTHAHGFRGWKSPTTRRNAGRPAHEGEIRPRDQLPDNSGSESDG